jgi:hypothetical protein
VLTNLANALDLDTLVCHRLAVRLDFDDTADILLVGEEV